MTYRKERADSDSVNLGSNPSSPATKKTKRIRGFRASKAPRKTRKSENRQRTRAARKPAQPPIVAKPNETSQNGYAIVGPHGNVWGPSVFNSPEDAAAHIIAFWRGTNRKIDWDKWGVCWAKQTTRRIRGAKTKPFAAARSGRARA